MSTQQIIDAMRLDTAERILRSVAANYARTGELDEVAFRLAARQVRMAHDSAEREPFAARMLSALQRQSAKGGQPS